MRCCTRTRPVGGASRSSASRRGRRPPTRGSRRPAPSPPRSCRAAVGPRATRARARRRRRPRAGRRSTDRAGRRHGQQVEVVVVQTGEQRHALAVDDLVATDRAAGQVDRDDPAVVHRHVDALAVDLHVGQRQTGALMVPRSSVRRSSRRRPAPGARPTGPVHARPARRRPGGQARRRAGQRHVDQPPSAGGQPVEHGDRGGEARWPGRRRRRRRSGARRPPRPPARRPRRRRRRTRRGAGRAGAAVSGDRAPHARPPRPDHGAGRRCPSCSSARGRAASSTTSASLQQRARGRPGRPPSSRSTTTERLPGVDAARRTPGCRAGRRRAAGRSRPSRRRRPPRPSRSAHSGPAHSDVRSATTNPASAPRRGGRRVADPLGQGQAAPGRFAQAGARPGRAARRRSTSPARRAGTHGGRHRGPGVVGRPRARVVGVEPGGSAPTSLGAGQAQRQPAVGGAQQPGDPAGARGALPAEPARARPVRRAAPARRRHTPASVAQAAPPTGRAVGATVRATSSGGPSARPVSAMAPDAAQPRVGVDADRASDSVGRGDGRSGPWARRSLRTVPVHPPHRRRAGGWLAAGRATRTWAPPSARRWSSSTPTGSPTITARVADAAAATRSCRACWWPSAGLDALVDVHVFAGRRPRRGGGAGRGARRWPPLAFVLLLRGGDDRTDRSKG